MTSTRGDSARDHAAFEMELCHEHRRLAERSRNNSERDRLLEIAGLHADAAQLLLRLARVYDQLGEFPE